MKIMQHIRAFKSTKAGFCISKLLAVFIIYVLALVAVDAAISLLILALDGRTISIEQSDLLLLYLFIFFIIVISLYIRFVEKKKWSDFRLSFTGKCLARFLLNLLFGALLVLLMVFILCCAGVGTFTGLHFDMGALPWIAAFLLGYIVQSSAEELLFRGFLQNALSAKLSSPAAVIITSLAFCATHVFNLAELSPGEAATAAVNLMLLSVLFSLIMIKDNSVLSACGLHAGWNYMMSSALGLQLSGIEAAGAGSVASFHVISQNAYLTGGNYGIEGSLLTTPVLIIASIAVYLLYKRKKARAQIAA